MTKRNQKVKTGEKKNSLVVVLLIFIAVIACAMAGYTFYEMKHLRHSIAGNKKTEVSNKHVETEAPIYVPMETFTVSLQPDDDSAERVIYIGLTLKLKDENSKSLVEKYLPDLRSRVYILLSHQQANVLATDEGKKQLIKKIKETLSTPVAQHQNILLSDVLFNAFILR